MGPIFSYVPPIIQHYKQEKETVQEAPLQSIQPIWKLQLNVRPVYHLLVKWPFCFILGNPYTALQMKNNTKSASSISPGTMEFMCNSHDSQPFRIITNQHLCNSKGKNGTQWKTKVNS